MKIFGSKTDKKVTPADTEVKADSSLPKVTKSKVVADSKSDSVQKSAFHSDYLIHYPHVTEKAHDISPLNQHIFKVSKKANKTEIKKVINNIYNVEVDKVRIINTPGKKRRLGRTIGKKPGYKKAIVTLKEGHRIEIIPAKQS